jgi:hypothetical protein
MTQRVALYLQDATTSQRLDYVRYAESRDSKLSGRLKAPCP